MPVVVEVQARAVVDEVKRLVPPQQVRIARRPVHVGDERIEPHRCRRQLASTVRSLRAPDRTSRSPADNPSPDSAPRWPAAVRGSPGPAHCGPAPRPLPSAPVPAPASPSARPISPAISSATSASGPCPAPAELQHIEAAVVRLHDRGQRAALAQRRHIAGGLNGSQQANSLRQLPHELALHHAWPPGRPGTRGRAGESCGSSIATG